MATASQTAPATSISTIVGANFTGAWTRAGADRTDNFVEMVEIELFRHLGSHTGEVALWTHSGVVTAADSYADSYTVPLPSVIDLADDYCWRVRLRDNFGSWTAWSDKRSLVYTSTAPVLSLPSLLGMPTFETLRHVFFGAAYSDADGDRPHRLYVRLYATTSEEVVTATEDPYMGTTYGRLSRPGANLISHNLTAVTFSRNGDSPQPGDPYLPLTGPLLEYIGTYGSQTGFRVLGHGVVKVSFMASMITVMEDNHTYTVYTLNNGATIESLANSKVQSGLSVHSWEMYPNFMETIDVAVVEGDEITASAVSSAPSYASDIIPWGTGNSTHGLLVEADPGDLSTGEEVIEIVYSPDLTTLLWATEGQYEGLRDEDGVGTWYNGRALGAGRYYWTMTATDKRGTVSNELDGYIILSKGQEPDPGESPNLTGYATP